MARGAANGEIASELGASLKTVRNHVSNVFTKLRVTTRAQAIVTGRQVGMGTGASGIEGTGHNSAYPPPPAAR